MVEATSLGERMERALGDLRMVKVRRGAGGPPKKKGDRMHTGTGLGSSESVGPQIDPRIQHEIGKHLRAHYDDIVNEPVPDKFMELLEKLEKSVSRRR
jgi:hypothetical protein